MDGYINPGDKIIIRLGDRRFGARGTRVQTFVEEKFLMRWYIDPVGTSRFAPIRPDIAIKIKSGEAQSLKVLTPRLARPRVEFSVFAHTQDIWGNATTDLKKIRATLLISPESENPEHSLLLERALDIPETGWSYAQFSKIIIDSPGDYRVTVTFYGGDLTEGVSGTAHLTIGNPPVPRILFGDLHVHSDDTVGTNDSTYNFSYAQKIAGLDVVGYTANDFNITAARWQSTLNLIKEINSEGEFVVFPGTEWCGNSAVGGDHNVVFLDDPNQNAPEFPLDKNGNVARSFEWNEDGPAELQPGTWPLDEVYATYAHASDTHLMIPHVGGRRCNLAWHHPKLERLVEIGSAWGLFEWLIQDSVARGWKMGVCANSDEHRGRCGGGVPGTAVFGVKGGLTGIISDRLDRESVAKALRARRTFATTGERLVGLISTENGALQGDEIVQAQSKPLQLDYKFYGSSGFSVVEAYDANGCIFQRNLWAQHSERTTARPAVRVTWGGARLYDRYREAVWIGEIHTRGKSRIVDLSVFGGVTYVPEEHVGLVDDYTVSFSTRTSGDFDGVHLLFEKDNIPEEIIVKGKLQGYVKVGDVIKGNPHKPQPTFQIVATREQIGNAGGLVSSIKGGADLSINIAIVPDVTLPKHVEGTAVIEHRKGVKERSIYFVGREWDGGKVVTSPIFVKYQK